MTTTTTHTETHVFYISPSWHGQPGFVAEYRPLNPKNGKPWQASRRIYDAADIALQGYSEPIAYSTQELAEAAVARQAAKLTKSRGKA